MAAACRLYSLGASVPAVSQYGDQIDDLVWGGPSTLYVHSVSFGNEMYVFGSRGLDARLFEPPGTFEVTWNAEGVVTISPVP